MILFLISSYRINNSGSGGHYFTCETIYKEYKKNFPAMIVNVGDFISPSLEKSLPELVRVKVKRYDFLVSLREISALVLENKVSLIHAFDSFSYNLARLVAIRTGVPVLSTKCGGPNARYWPGWVPDTVLSKENYDFYSEVAEKKGLNRPLLIPGRASLNVDNGSENDGLENIRIIDGKVNVVRVGRLHASYLDSHIQAINLVEALNELGCPAHLHIIGFVNDQWVYDALEERKSDCISIHVDAAYTMSASRHLAHADVVIASGRGVMEAAALGKIVMCSASGNTFPVLLGKENFDNFFAMNFSPRIEPLENDSIEGRVRVIERLMAAPEVRIEYQIFIKKMFNDFFDVRNSVIKYSHLYDLKITEEKKEKWSFEVLFGIFLDLVKKFIRRLGGNK